MDRLPICSEVLTSFPWWAALDLAVIFAALTSSVWLFLLYCVADGWRRDRQIDREARAIAARVRGGR